MVNPVFQEPAAIVVEICRKTATLAPPRPVQIHERDVITVDNEIVGFEIAVNDPMVG